MAASQAGRGGRAISAWEAGCQACSADCCVPVAQKSVLRRSPALGKNVTAIGASVGETQGFSARRPEIISNLLTVLGKTRSEKK